MAVMVDHVFKRQQGKDATIELDRLGTLYRSSDCNSYHHPHRNRPPPRSLLSILPSTSPSSSKYTASILAKEKSVRQSYQRWRRRQLQIVSYARWTADRMGMDAWQEDSREERGSQRQNGMLGHCLICESDSVNIISPRCRFIFAWRALMLQSWLTSAALRRPSLRKLSIGLQCIYSIDA